MCPSLRNRIALATTCLVTATLLVYLPGLTGDFAFDDYHAIVNNPTLALARFDMVTLLDAALSTNTGPFRRPLAMLTFAFNRSVIGPEALGYKGVNLAIHGLNVVLVYALGRLLVARLASAEAPQAALAFTFAALWALHPLQLSAVLYVVQRMTSLCASFMLLALLAYARARSREIAGQTVPRWQWALVPTSGCLALLVKETALLLPLFLLTLELRVFHCAARPQWRQPLRGVLVLLVGVGAALLWWQPPLIFASYVWRDYSLLERLLTEARVLVFYLRLLVLPTPGAFALFHDDIAWSQGLLMPWTTLPSVLFIAALAVLATLGRWSALAFGCAWYLCAHLLESTVYPLEMVHEHRNYLATLGPLLALLVHGEALLRRSGAGRWRLPIATVAVLACAAITGLRAATWADPLQMAASEAHYHPHSSRSLYELGRLQIAAASRTLDQALHAAGLAALARAADLEPRSPLPVAALINTLLATGQDPTVWLTRVATLPLARQGEVLSEMVQCQARGRCPAAAAPVMELAGRLLGVRDMPAWQRRQTVESLAIFYMRVLGDTAGGLAMLREAAAQAPTDLALAVRLAEALVAAGQLAEARALGATIADRLPMHAPFSRRDLWRRLRALRAEG